MAQHYTVEDPKHFFGTYPESISADIKFKHPNIKPGDIVTHTACGSFTGRYIWNTSRVDPLDLRYPGGAVPMNYIYSADSTLFSPVYWKDILPNGLTWPNIDIRMQVAEALNFESQIGDILYFVAQDVEFCAASYNFQIGAKALYLARQAVLNMLRPFAIYSETRDPKNYGRNIVTLTLERDPWNMYPNE